LSQDRLSVFPLLRDACAHYLRQYPRLGSAVLALALLSSGATAFAVAALGPDAADLPVRQILEPVRLQPQLPEAAGGLPHMTLYRSEMVRSGDSIDSLLARLGVADRAAADYLRQQADVREQLVGRSGRNVQAQTDDSHRLSRLTVRYVDDDSGNFKRLIVAAQPPSAAGPRFSSHTETAPLQASERIGSGIIDSSLFATMDEARLPDALTEQLAEIFGNKIDFHHDLRRGDRFSIIYQTLEADGLALSTGRILSAELVNRGRPYSALWFEPEGQGKGGYYSFNGESLESSYLSSPLAFTRVTSGFSGRYHPIQKQWKAHTGVDLGAPTGTPIRTVGAGVVEFAGRQAGYGNVVFIKHNDSQTTVYAHMSRIRVVAGQKVGKGDNIGAVGATGWATGPHLHFELRVHGEFKDPLTIAQYSADLKLSGAARPAFERQVAWAQLSLNASRAEQLARAD
jgi:murein DD-endopeptidase MepM/ murein hydrolase activator NlpD